MKHAKSNQQPRDDQRKFYMPKELSALNTPQSAVSSTTHTAPIGAAHSGMPISDDAMLAATAIPGGYSNQSVSAGELNQSSETVDAHDNTHQSAGILVMVHGASGGIGTSVLTACIAWSLKKRNYECALIDLDLCAGGLDVLLGQESAPGLRWSKIRAPLGRIDGQALCQELPRWQGMPMLASDAWQHSPAQWWEMLAAVRALLACKTILIADCGTQYPKYLQTVDDEKTGLDTVPVHQQSSAQHMPHGAQRQAKHGRVAQEQYEILPAGVQVQAHTVVHIVVVEMSILGLARARGMVQSWRHCADPSIAHEWRNVLFIGKQPHIERALQVTREDAQAYLHQSLIAQFSWQRTVHKSIYAGFGLPSIPRAYRRELQTVCNAILQHLTVPEV